MSPRLIDARDIGVSYFVTGIVGTLTHHIVRPWRWAYLAGCVAVFGTALAIRANFTGVGHLCALALGLACHPLVRGRTGSEWNPAPALRRLRHTRTSAA